MNPSEQLRASFRHWMQQENLSVAGWAKRAGLPESTIRNFLSGRSETITHATLALLAKSLNIPLKELISFEFGPQFIVNIQAEIYADRWLKDDVDRIDGWFEISLPPDPRYPTTQRQAAILQDDSVNRIFRQGSILLYADYMNTGRLFGVGDSVVIAEMRSSPKGKSLELRRSIRHIVDDGSGWWLTFQSTLPRWQNHLRITSYDDTDRDLQNPAIEVDSPHQTTIEGVDVASYRLE